MLRNVRKGRHVCHAPCSSPSLFLFVHALPPHVHPLAPGPVPTPAPLPAPCCPHRTSAGLHPLLCLPPAFAPASCLAAALQFMATYWATVDPGLPVFGAVRTALARSGLAADLKHAPPLPPHTAVRPIGADGPGTPRDDPSGRVGGRQGVHQLQAALLTNPGGAGAGSEAVGAAVMACCVDLASSCDSPRAMPAAATAAIANASAVASPASPLAIAQTASQVSLTHAPAMCARAVGSEVVHSLVRLVRAVSRSAHHPQGQGAQSPPNVPSQSQLLPLQQLAPVMQRACRQIAAAVVGDACGGGVGAGSPKAIGPWHLAAMQASQPRIRLLQALCAACSALPGEASGDHIDDNTSTSNDGDNDSAGGESRAACAALDADACLSVFSLSPPGTESQCLAALTRMCSPRVLTPLLEACLSDIQALQSACPKLHTAACGHRSLATDATAAEGRSTDAPYPAPTTLNPESVGPVLLSGYAAAWLSMVAVGGGGREGGARVRNQPPPDLPCPTPFLPDPQGSRLPPPPTWLLSETLALPPPPKKPAPGPCPPPAHPVAACLLLACGLEASGSVFMGGAVLGGAGAKLAAAMQLAYLHDAMELTRGGGGGEAGAMLGTIKEEGGEGEGEGEGVRGGRGGSPRCGGPWRA